MVWRLVQLFIAAVVVSIPVARVFAQDPPALDRLGQAQRFHLRAQERPGLLVPMYVYPSRVEHNAAYSRLIELKREYPTVPMWVIANPASGPGRRTDANHARAIDRLIGAGCVVLGYVATSYGKKTSAEVLAEVQAWRRLYPRHHGIFFDEMIYEDTEAAAAHQAALTKAAHEAGCWPVVANPGAETPGRYFAAEAADVIVIHEGGSWPGEERLRGNRAGGYADYPPFTRAVLVHSQEQLDRQALRTATKYARWVYVTEAPFRAGDPNAANPWDRLSKHAGDLCAVLAER